MMRLEDSREAGLLSSSSQYSSLETTMRMSEFDVPMSKRPRGKQRRKAVSACIALIVVAALVCAFAVSVKKNGRDSDDDDDDVSHHMRNAHDPLAPAPSPEPTDFGGPSSPPPAPAASPLPLGPAPMPAFGPSAYSPSYDLAVYEIICNKTVNRAVCLNVFASNPNSPKVDLQQWTIMAMEAAEKALNESYSLAMGMKGRNSGNVALQQCIDVFADALDQVNSSMYLVADMDVHNPGTTGTDVQTALSAARTNQDTCQEGIDDAGPFPGSERITGQQASHVDTLLSIALTFANDLTTSSTDPNHHRRLLHLRSTVGRVALGRRGLLSLQVSRSLGRSLSQAKPHL